jgi:hypothetical protein
VNGRQRLLVVALVLAALLGAVVLIAFASVSCPATVSGQACPEASVNRVVVVALAALTTGLLVTPFAFLGEFAVRRRIVYLVAWSRAARRGALVAAIVGCLAALRLGGALSVPVGLFIATLAAIAEWFAIRRFDAR